MYVIQSHSDYGQIMLHEMDKGELRLAKVMYPLHSFRVVSGVEAHRWVRGGGNHTTPLWVDRGRIRYARDAA
jgi:hypothetical protein